MYLLKVNFYTGCLLAFYNKVHIPEHTRSLSGSLLGYKTIP